MPCVPDRYSTGVIDENRQVYCRLSGASFVRFSVKGPCLEVQLHLGCEAGTQHHVMGRYIDELQPL